MPRAHRLAAALCVLALGAPASLRAEGRVLRGRVVLAAGEGISLGDVAPVVVYLEGGETSRTAAPGKPALVADDGASFRPGGRRWRRTTERR